MARKRPTAVLVLAILNLVFGASSALCYLCVGAVVALVAVALGQPGARQDPALRDLKDALASLNQQAPLLVPGMIADAVFSVVLALLLCLAGLGLLGMRPWARFLCLFCAAADLLAQAGSLVFRYAYVNPAMDRWEQTFRAGHPQMQGDPFSLLGNSPVGDLVAGSSVFFSAAYDVAILIVLLRPSIAAAFAGGTAPEGQRAQEDAEADDLDHEWRRPREGQDGGL